MKVLLTSIHVSDPVSAFNFYTKVLGFKEQLFMPEANLAVVVSSKDPNGTGLMLEPNDTFTVKNYQKEMFEKGLPVIVFSVNDLREEFDRLQNLGVVFRKGPVKTEWGFEAVFEDSFGNLIQIMQQ